MSGRRAGWVRGSGWRWFVVAVDHVAVGEAMYESVGVVGVAFDGAVAAVDGVVVVRAVRGEVRCVGWAVVAGPVRHVVGFEVAGVRASRVAAGAVAVEDDAAGVGWDGVLFAAYVDRDAAGFPQWPHHPITGQLFEQGAGDAGAVVDPGAFGVEVDAKVSGSSSRCRAMATIRLARRGDRPVCHANQCSGLRNPGPPHASTASASATSWTMRACSTFKWPQSVSNSA
jgi:hypothetical protein